MAADLPISDADVAELFAGLARYRLLVLAVSGGSDSVALMHLVARWRSMTATAPIIHVASVDHGLRSGSRDDAAWVATEASTLGMPAHVLTWHGDKPDAGIQEAARSARYELLAGLLRELAEGDAALVTAHTADDQAETLLMRLARGSGIDGLAAMPECRRLLPDAPFDLVRPLLRVPKQSLLATLRASGLGWREDPSNARPQFERVRLRAAAATLAELGLTAEKLALSAHRLQRARGAIDASSADFQSRALDLNDGAFAAIDRRLFAAAPEELRLRLMLRVLDRFGGASPPARLAKVEALMARLADTERFSATLGGCAVAALPGQIQVYREAGRITQPESRLREAEAVTWDSRFSVSVAGLSRQMRHVTVKPLGGQAYASLRRATGARLPSRIAAGLPAFWAGSELLAVPALSGASKIEKLAPELTFHANFLGLPEDLRISD